MRLPNKQAMAVARFRVLAAYAGGNVSVDHAAEMFGGISNFLFVRDRCVTDGLISPAGNVYALTDAGRAAFTLVSDATGWPAPKMRRARK